MQFLRQKFGYKSALALTILLCLPPLLRAQTRIKVSKRYAPQIDIAITLFENRGPTDRKLSPQLTNLLMDDLYLSGFFTPLTNKEFIAEAEALDWKTGKINLQEWSSLGAEVVIKGAYRVSGGKIAIECRAIDVSRGKQVYGKKFSGRPLDDRRKVIHKIADEIVTVLTGERGLAQTEIAFVSTRGGEKKIYTMEASGHEWRRVNSGPGLALSPDWSPDGRQLVYTSYSSNFPWVFLDNLARGKRKVLSAQPGLNAFPAVSPDGRWVALTLSRDGNNEIYKMSIDGRKLQRLTYGRANDCSPAWSPDGRKIAFTSDRRGSPQIYVMNADGKNVRRLKVSGNYNTSPAWSPDGELIAYASLSGGNFEIYAVNVKTGEVTRLTKNRYDDEDPSWAPDSRHLVYASKRGRFTNLFALDIFNPDPIQITRGEDCFSPAWGPYRPR